MTQERDEMMLIGAIRMHANANYNKGWDAVVEGWDDGEILEWLSNNNMNLKKAIKDIQDWVTLRQERMENTGGY